MSKIKVRVLAEVEVGMRLDRKDPLAVVSDTIFVTAIGDKHILAIDPEGTEHKFAFAQVEKYEMSGWACWAKRLA